MAPTYVDSGPDRIVVYTLGPGYGECQLVLTPTGQVVMVDACTKEQRNHGIELLKTLNYSRVDLFVVTHPDTDHVRGARDILVDLKPDKVWTYPIAASLRSLLAPAFRRAGSASPKKLKDLDDFLTELRPIELEDRVWSMASNSADAWRDVTGECLVRPLAPTQYDVSKARAEIERLVQGDASGVTLANELLDYFAGKRNAAGDRPNRLSVALSIEWNSRRVVLAGDVECHDTHERSGWRGVLKSLSDRGELHRVREVDLVKVAHHGSDGAFHEEAWHEHCRNNKETTAFIAPFSSSGLPDEETIGKLRVHASRLAVTSPLQSTLTRTATHNWKPLPASDCVTHPDWTLPVIAAVIPKSGAPELHLSSAARAWSR